MHYLVCRSLEYIDCEGFSVGPIAITEPLYFCALGTSYIITGDIEVASFGFCEITSTTTTTTILP